MMDRLLPITRRLMFFDDYPRDTENQLFIYQLSKIFDGTDIVIDVEKTIPHLEVLLRERNYVAIILDIMASFPERPDAQERAGLEILERCRAGEYGEANKSTLIYMRTARGEIHIKEEAFRRGCNGYFRVGSNDEKLLQTLLKVI